MLASLRGRASGLLMQLGAAVAALLVCLAFGLRYPPQLASHPFALPRGSKKWGSIADPNWHRRLAQLEFNDTRSEQDTKLLAAYARRRAAGEPAAPPIVAEGLCVKAYELFDTLIIHDYGLTDPVLARLPREFGRPGHKLIQVEAAQMVQLKKLARSRGAASPTPKSWYELPNVPGWVRSNRETLALLEQKLHNQHDLVQNLRLASMRLKLK
jgi:hypothetical protein